MLYEEIPINIFVFKGYCDKASARQSRNFVCGAWINDSVLFIKTRHTLSFWDSMSSCLFKIKHNFDKTAKFYRFFTSFRLK